MLGKDRILDDDRGVMPRRRKPASPFRYFHSSHRVIRRVVMMYVGFPYKEASRHRSGEGMRVGVPAIAHRAPWWHGRAVRER